MLSSNESTKHFIGRSLLDLTIISFLEEDATYMHIYPGPFWSPWSAAALLLLVSALVGAVLFDSLSPPHDRTRLLSLHFLNNLKESLMEFALMISDQ